MAKKKYETYKMGQEKVDWTQLSEKGCGFTNEIWIKGKTVKIFI